MSGLYNMLFGENDPAGFLIGLINSEKKISNFGRYRDVYVTENHIVVHTRNGGGNREYYQDVFDECEKHPLYSHNSDNDFDCTYADIFFNHPPEFSEALKEMAKNILTPSQKWEIAFKAFDEMKK